MRKLHTIIALCAFLICTSQQLVAQVVFSAPEVSVEPGNNVEVEFTTENFNSIVSIQFAIHWNPSILEFDHVVPEFVLEGMDADNIPDHFNLMTAEEGTIRFSWFHGPTTGQTVANGAAIFKIVFKAIGSTGTSTPINLGPDGSGFPVEVVNSDEQEVSTTMNNGTVNVGPNNVTNQPVNSDFTLLQNAPNPFTNETYINFELKTNSKATLSIFDLSGKVIFANEGNFGTGEHSIYLNRDVFSGAGTYFYQLKTTDYIATKKLVVF